jgi:hypothetical protein
MLRRPAATGAVALVNLWTVKNKGVDDIEAAVRTAAAPRLNRHRPLADLQDTRHNLPFRDFHFDRLADGNRPHGI